MKTYRNNFIVVFSLMLALAACAPSVEVEGPRTAVYQGNPQQVFSTINIEGGFYNDYARLW